MKILFVAGQAIKSNSSVTMMNIGYIKGLIEEGHDVHVITSKIPENHISLDQSLKLPECVKIKEYKISDSYDKLSNKKYIEKENKIKLFIKNIMREIYYSISIYDSQKMWINNTNDVNFEDEKYDLIISSSDPKHSHLFVEKLIKGNKIKYKKWIQLWGDPMYHDITRKNTFFKQRLFKEENRLIGLADKVFYVSPLTLEQQKSTFVEHKDKMDFILIPYFNKNTQEPTQCNNPKFGYFGDFNSNVRNLEPLYEAANLDKTNLIIRGSSDLNLENTESIDVGPRVTTSVLEELEKDTDVFIHLCNCKGTQIPAKVYYYSGTKKPILFILDGKSDEIRKIFSKYNRYIFCENNIKSIAEALKKIKCKKYDVDATRIVEEFSPKSIARELISKIER